MQLRYRNSGESLYSPVRQIPLPRQRGITGQASTKPLTKVINSEDPAVKLQ
jgi:hypothetical protein